MIGLETFSLGLIAVSILTGLSTEAIKMLYEERNKQYKANTIAGIVAVLISIFVGAGYMFVMNTSFTAQFGVTLFALAFLSWLCAMLGYDKVIQAIKQYKVKGKD